MKKVLFATTALVFSAGFAAAEVAVSGDARIGLRYDSDNTCEYNGVVDPTCPADGTRSTWNVVNRARVHFTMTGESDSGLSFGAKLRADQAGAANRGAKGSGVAGEVWVSGTYGKLTAGDIDSAMETAVGDLAEVGLSGLDFHNELGYVTSDDDDTVQNDAGLLYEYAINGVKVFASFHDQYYGQSGYKVEDNAWSLGAAYEMAGYNFGLGYEKRGDLSHWGLSAAGEFAGAKAKGVYTRIKDYNAAGDDADQYGLSADYAMANGVNLSGFWRHVETKPAVGDNVGVDYLGLGAGYDLGGGATVKGGVVHVSADEDVVNLWNAERAVDGETMADFGLEFKF